MLTIKDLIDRAYEAFEQSNYHELAKIKEAFVNTPVLQGVNMGCGAYLYMSIELQDLPLRPPLFLRVMMKIKDFEMNREGIVHFHQNGEFSIHQSGKEKLISGESINNWLVQEAKYNAL